MNYSKISNRAAIMMSDVLSRFGFVLEKGKLIKKAEGTGNTEFSISVNFDVERIDGRYDIEPTFVVRLPYFEVIESKFIDWQGGGSSNAKSNLNLIFYSHGFRPLYQNITRKRIPLFSISTDEELYDAIEVYSNLAEKEIGEWILQWDDWSSARGLMDANESLGGAWRNTAYFALLERGFGRRAACSWLDTDGPVTYSRRLRAQIDFLRDFCAGKADA